MAEAPPVEISRILPDLKWLDVLKASGAQAGALAVASGGFLILAQWGVMPAPDPWMIIAAFAVLLASTCLASARMIEVAAKVIPWRRWLSNWRVQSAVAAYIPFMTKKERRIVAYLLAQHGNVVHVDVLSAARCNHDYPATHQAIPEYVWQVLEKHKEHFPYEPKLGDGVEVYPWRRGWME